MFRLKWIAWGDILREHVAPLGSLKNLDVTRAQREGEDGEVGPKGKESRHWWVSSCTLRSNTGLDSRAREESPDGFKQWSNRISAQKSSVVGNRSVKNSITLNNDGHTQQIHELQWDHKLLRNLSLGEGLADKSKGQEAFSQGALLSRLGSSFSQRSARCCCRFCQSHWLQHRLTLS